MNSKNSSTLLSRAFTYYGSICITANSTQNKIGLDYCINLYGLSEHHFTNDISYAWYGAGIHSWSQNVLDGRRVPINTQ